MMFPLSRAARFALGTAASSVAIYQVSRPEATRLDPPRDVLLQNASFGSLVRTWIVYKSCDVSFFVHHAEKIISTLESIPGVAALTRVGLRQTIFPQFCGGETVTECLTEIARLRQAGVGSILHYSVEASEADHAQITDGVPASVLQHAARSRQETSEGIDLLSKGAARAQDRAWLCVKLTGLTDANLLYEVSQALRTTGTRTDLPFPHTPDDKTKCILTGSPNAFASLPICKSLEPATRARFIEFYQQLRGLAAQAKQQGVRLMIDSEQSWYQPAMDVLQMALASGFNRPDSNESAYIPTVYATSQCYLARNNPHLRSLVDHAKVNHYTFAVKLVRGAYMDNERYFAHQRGEESPIVPDKATADDQYDSSSFYLLERINEDRSTPSVAFMAATHNEKSAQRVIEYLDSHGLADKNAAGLRRLSPEVENRVHFAQLFGMSDDLTACIAGQFESTDGPIVTKYLPYGPMAEVIPYLCRRVADNSSILNGDRGASYEANRIWQEMRRRVGL